MKNLKLILTVIFAGIIIVSVIVGKNNTYQNHSQTEFVMDTIGTIEVWDNNMKKSAEAIRASFDEVKRIEGLTSYFVQGSDTSRINAAKAEEWVNVSRDTFEILSAAVEISQKSGGAFDVTVASVTELWNFSDAANSKVPALEDIERGLENVGYSGLRFVNSADNPMVMKDKDGIKIDLGGIAKGYAADRAVRVLKDRGISTGIVDLGGNIIVFGDREFSIGLQKPFAARGEYSRIVKVKNKAVVTSGTYERNFTLDGKVYHHILNPVTGYPAEGDINAVSIVADSGVYADALSTAAFVIGCEDEEGARKLVEDMGYEVYFE